MDYLIGWREYETEFNGDKVTMQIRPMAIKAMLKIAPYMKTTASLDTDDNMALLVNALELGSLANDILPDYVKDISGFTIGGEQPTIERLANEAVFCSLLVDIIGKLANISSITQGEEKNSEGLSASQASEEKTNQP